MAILSSIKSIVKRGGKRPLGKLSSRELIDAESAIGRKLFGPIPAGHSRDFFCLDEYTWVWHEEWKEGKEQRTMTVRYEVRPDGIVKVSGDGNYSYVRGAELENLTLAIKLYYEQVMRGVYNIDPATGKPLG
jgi:hypothetical protein